MATSSESKEQRSKQAPAEPSVLPGIMVDFGKRRRSQVKDLKKGEGKLMDKVEEAIDQAVVELGDEAQGKTILPVIVILEKRPKKSKLPSLFNL